MRDGTLGMSTGASEPQVQAKAHQYIEQSADRHLVRLVSQLLAHGQLSSTWARMFGRERRRDRGRGQGGREARERGGGERWKVKRSRGENADQRRLTIEIAVILKLSREVCKRVILNVRGGDKMNVRNYVKVLSHSPACTHLAKSITCLGEENSWRNKTRLQVRGRSSHQQKRNTQKDEIHHRQSTYCLAQLLIGVSEGRE